MTLLLELSAEKDEKFSFKNINSLRTIIAHKEYCKYETDYFNDVVNELNSVQAWLEEKIKKINCDQEETIVIVLFLLCTLSWK